MELESTLQMKATMIIIVELTVVTINIVPAMGVGVSRMVMEVTNATVKTMGTIIIATTTTTTTITRDGRRRQTKTNTSQ